MSCALLGSRLWTSDFDIMDVLSAHSDFIEMREPYSKAKTLKNWGAVLKAWATVAEFFEFVHLNEKMSCMFG